MGQRINRTAELRTQAYELVKQYVTYDAADRPEYVYTAPTDAVEATPCTVVQYEYVNATEQRVTKMKESTSTWQAAWDIT